MAITRNPGFADTNIFELLMLKHDRTYPGFRRMYVRTNIIKLILSGLAIEQINNMALPAHSHHFLKHPFP